jgi:UDP-glucose 4-epimerase
MEAVVTGGAGYIGGHLVDKLVELGYTVYVYDDFSSGNYVNPKALYSKVDLRKGEGLRFPKGSVVFHMAANPDVRTSMQDTYDHFSRDVTLTFNVLEAARKSDVSFFLFASSSTVYGEADKFPTPEDYPKRPISFYGLFKLLGEEMLEYYSRNYGIRGVSLRFANITGGRVSHGVVIDFVRKLMKNPNELEILGNGRQRKSYLYISDLIDSLLFLMEKSRANYDVFNVGNVDWITVEEIARIVEEEMGLRPKHVYKDTGDGRGWPGDVRFMLLDVSKIMSLGWKPRYTSEQAVRLAVRDVLKNLNYTRTVH